MTIKLTACFSSNNMNWCTPKKLFKELDKEFHFVLDPAATDKSAKCKRFYTPKEDGLKQSWNFGGAVFCNPPYGRDISNWVRKAFEESQKCRFLWYYFFRVGQTLHIFTTTFTEKQRFDFCEEG